MIDILGEESVLILDLESMHASSEKFKNRLISFLKIRPEITLDQSTFLGKPWILKGTTGNDFSGLSETKANYTWNSILDSFELQFLKKYMGKAQYKLGYIEESELHGSSAPIQSPRFSWLDSDIVLSQPSKFVSGVIVDIHLKYLNAQLNPEERMQLIDDLAQLLDAYMGKTSISYFSTKTQTWSRDLHVKSISPLLVQNFIASLFFLIYLSVANDPTKCADLLIFLSLHLTCQGRYVWLGVEKIQCVSSPEVLFRFVLSFGPLFMEISYNKNF